MSKKLWFYIGFFVLLFLGFVFAMAKFIPGFTTVKMPVLSYVQPFTFTDQNSQAISEKSVAGKVYVAEPCPFE